MSRTGDAALIAFNEGYDYAIRKITEANDCGHFHYITITSIARGFRHDYWWREGTTAALDLATRNGKIDAQKAKARGYRDPLPRS